MLSNSKVTQLIQKTTKKVYSNNNTFNIEEKRLPIWIKKPLLEEGEKAYTKGFPQK